jgi:hypothetical protein
VDDNEAGFTPAVEGWYRAISKLLADKQWPDGPIIALMVDNEAPGQHQPVLNKQLTDVRWPIWLRKRYDGINALNATYSTNYHTVNEVPFPQTWLTGNSPLERDARAFMEEVQNQTITRYTQILSEAGWHVPFYPSDTLPNFRSYSQAEENELFSLASQNKIINIRQPFQIDPNPSDVGQTPAWAIDGPIRADGSLRRTFWHIRDRIWSHNLPDVTSSNGAVVATFEGARLVTCNSDTPLKLAVPAGSKPVVYRQRATGELFLEETFKVRRGKLTGKYLAEDEIEQTDLIFILANPTDPLTDFPLTYLIDLLAGQRETLARGAILVERLAKTVTPQQETPSPAEALHPKQTLSTLEEARRGLREADTALRKAMSSISGLETGFATILDKNETESITQPAPTAITPELFEGPAREILMEIGAVCAELEPRLKSATTNLQDILETSDNLTIEQYRQGWDNATKSAIAARLPLLKMISYLRLQLGSEKLPLILWRVHDQVQEIVETLRWGVLRR